jgi:lipoyl(octanoyl) transferase
MQTVIFKDLGTINFQEAWEYQELLLQQNVQLKIAFSKNNKIENIITQFADYPATEHFLLFCEHPPVYTLGKSGNPANILISSDEMKEKGIQFFKINRGGDITFHGLGQIVGYPIIDLEKMYTDIGRYLRELEEVVIDTLAQFGIKGERSKGETGVWINPDEPGKERKICAMGVRCSRWITMHGFALNVNTNLDYFKNIVPCGIVDKKVTSMATELNVTVDINAVKAQLKKSFEKVFKVSLIN